MLRTLPAAYSGWFLEEKLRIHVGRHKLTNIDKSKLYDLLTQERTIVWWVKLGRVDKNAVLLIDWNVTGSAMQSLSPTRRRWITKHTSGNCGVGVTLKKWGLQEDSVCSRASFLG